MGVAAIAMAGGPGASGVTCRGSYTLGAACGQCERCYEIQRLGRPRVRPTEAVDAPPAQETFIGIDNGVSGALAAITGTEIEVIPTPTIQIGTATRIDERAVSWWIGKFQKPRVVIEQGQKQPKFGCKGNFANGFNCATLQTVVRMMELPHRLVNPKDWQGDVFKGIRGAAQSTKSVAIEFCRRTFPQVDLRRTPRSSNADDNLADALCMAWWAKNFAFR